MTQKQKGIPNELMHTLTSRILNQIRDHDIFGAKLTMRSILKLPGQGNKVLRNIFIVILKSRYGLVQILHQDGNRGYESTDLMRAVILEKVTRILSEMDSKGLVKKGKLYTLPKIHAPLLTVDPEVLEYLFDSGKIVTSSKFTIATTVNAEPISKYMARVFMREATLIENRYGDLKTFGLDKNIMFDEIRLRIILIERIKNNLVYQIQKFGHIYPEINANALNYLSQEFAGCHKLDNHPSALYVRTLQAAGLRIPEEKYPQFASKLRQSVFKGIEIASDAINARDDAEVDPYKEFNVDLKDTSFYLDEIKENLDQEELQFAKDKD